MNNKTPGRSKAWTIISCSLATLSLAAGASAAEGDNSLYEFSPLPAWVEAIAAEYSAPDPPGGISDGIWYLLFDRQIDVTAAGNDSYVHSAVKVLAAAGVDDQSQIDITVDPTYQTLGIHSMRVVRNGSVLDQREVARITALPEETELQSRIYNGTYNVNILLSDVRVGDVVEYEYTLHSRDRIFPGHFSWRANVGWSNPMHRQSLRIRVPADRKIHFRMTHGQPAVETRVHDGIRELRWKWRDLIAIPGDDDRPSWYSTWPSIEVSDLQNWSEVARRVAPLYPRSATMEPALAAEVESLRRRGRTVKEQALLALQDVQEQIRYVSISIGPGGFTPTNPESVLGRHFGDCKDKALLLATILQHLGIDARPALVNTRFGRRLTDMLPTPYAFDHVIVRMKMGGEIYWLDGTASTQYSPLSPDAPADFERALIVDNGTVALATIPRPSAGVSSKVSDVYIDLRAGMDKPAKLEVRTSYKGELADSMRQDLVEGSAEQRQSNYVNYMARYYSTAKVSAPIAIHDDKVKNVVQTREYYVLEHPFKKLQNGKLQLFFEADELYSYLDAVDSRVRRSPLAIDFPVDVRQTIRARLPQEWAIKGESVKIDNPAFTYTSEVSYAEKSGEFNLVLDYHYAALSDAVEVDALAQYLADRERAYDDVGYRITSGGSNVAAARKQSRGSGSNPVIWFFLFFTTWVMMRWLEQLVREDRVSAMNPGRPGSRP